MDAKETLAYWIRERESVRQAKENGCAKPWSDDPVFQTTYFCNVRREDDRVTRWIRQNWSPEKIGWDDYEYAMVVARFLNWPDTLAEFFPIRSYQKPLSSPIHPNNIFDILEGMRLGGRKVWGNAYVVTTHGLHMPKAQYLCERVLPAAYEALGAGRWRRHYQGIGHTLAYHHARLMRLEGLASFMAAQVIADLKNTHGHPLQNAKDWVSWSAPGPGSLRGLAWYHGVSKVTEREYQEKIAQVYAELPPDCVEKLGGGMQDLQNCLCEYDKYMRVKNGTGRSKRSYPGT